MVTATARPLALVVDDAATVRRYHAHILETAGFEVLEAANGLEALEAVLRRLPQLILVDINMPKMDGYAMLRRLREDEPTRHLPAVMVSTEAEAHDRSAAFAAGANFYLVKPAPPERLGRIARLLALDTRP